MVKNLILEDVDVVVIDPDNNSRHTIRNALTDNGFRRIAVGSTFNDLSNVMEESPRDLLIIDKDIPDVDLSDFVRKLRHNETKFNPFIPIIATAWSPTIDDINGIIESGVDHIVGKPLSSNQLMQRIKVLVLDRKPFVVTSQYVGPDRRKKDDKRDDGGIIPMIVPNTLHTKATGVKNEDPSGVQGKIDGCIKSINIQKLDRNASQVIYLVEGMMPALQEKNIDETTKKSLERLLYVSEDISRRMVGTPYDHVSSLCNTLIDVTKRIIEAGDSPNSKDVELLKPVSLSIQAGFVECDGKSQRMAKAISDSVERGQKNTPTVS